jgi:hypothetical protein
MSNVQYRRHLKVIDGDGYTDNDEKWIEALAESLDEWARRLPGYADYLRRRGVTEAAGAVAVAGQAALTAAGVLRRTVPSGPPLHSDTA